MGKFKTLASENTVYLLVLSKWRWVRPPFVATGCGSWSDKEFFTDCTFSDSASFDEWFEGLVGSVVGLGKHSFSVKSFMVSNQELNKNILVSNL